MRRRPYGCSRRTGRRTWFRARTWRIPGSSVRPASGRRRSPWFRRGRSTRWRGSRAPGCDPWLLDFRPPMPRAMTGQSPLSQQSSSIWWIFISAKSPPETQKKLVKLRICHISSLTPSASCPCPRPDGRGTPGRGWMSPSSPVADPLDQFLPVHAMAALQAGGDLEVLLLGLLAGAGSAAARPARRARTISP